MRKLFTISTGILFLFLILLSSIFCQEKFLQEEDTSFTKNFARNDLVYVAPTYPISTPKMTVGGIFDLTYPNGSVNLDGYEIFIAVAGNLNLYTNGQGRINISTKFYLDMVDGKTNSVDAVAAAVYLLSKDLVNTTQQNNVTSLNEIGAMFGSGNFVSLIDTASVFDGTGVPFLDSGNSLEASVGSAAYIPILNNYKTLFRLSPASSTRLARAVVDVLVYFNWTLVTPIFLDDYYGFNGQSSLLPELEIRDILTQCSTFVVDFFTNGGQETLNDTATCLKQSDSRLIILWMGANQAAKVARQLNDLVPNHYFVYFFPERLPNDTPITNPKDLASFADSIFYQPKLRDSLYNKSYTGKIETINPDSELPFIKEYWTVKFRCQLTDSNIALCPEELERRPNVTNPTCKCTGKENLVNTTISYKFENAADAVNLVALGIYNIQNNCSYLTTMSLQRRPADPTDFCALTEYQPAILSEAISYSRLNGLSGPLSFGNGTNFREVLQLALVQISGNGSLVTIGEYTSQLEINNSSLQFTNGQVPVSAVIPDNPDLSYAVVDVFFALEIIVLLVSLSLHFFFYYYRNNRVIRKSSPLFCQLMLVGVDLVLLAGIFDCFAATGAFCFLITWFLVLGAGLIVANLLAKTYRIFRIFGNMEASAVTIKDTDLLIFTGFVLLGELLWLFLYSFLSGVPEAVVKQSSTDIYYKYVICLVPSNAIQLTFQLILYAYNLILVLVAAGLAFATRKVDSAYNESRYIAFTIYSYLVALVILLPLYYTSGDSKGSNVVRYVLLAISILLTMSLTLGALFGPKVLQVFREEKKKRKRAEEDQNTRGDESTTQPNSSSAPASTRQRQFASTPRSEESTTRQRPIDPLDLM